MLAVADIDLIKLDLGLLLTAVESALRQERLTRAPRRQSTLREAVEVPDASGSEVVTALQPPRDAPITPLTEVAGGLPPRLNTDPEKAENGLAKLVLTLIE